MGDAEPEESAERLGGLFDGREEYAPPPSEGKRIALTEGLVVVDTNVLLHLYRFGPEARDELLMVLELLGDRLFVPAQVASEFVRRRLGVAMEMQQELQNGAKRVGESLQQLGDDLKALGRERGLSQQQKKKLTQVLKRAEENVRALLDEAAADRAWAESPSTPDTLLPRITKLLDGKVGNPYSDDRAKVLREEADRRIKAKIPPGWRDAAKEDPAGDYLLWRQALDEAAARRLPIFLVTDDVKEDWYLRVRGRTVGPLPELVREARKEAGAELYMSAVAGFLELAREALAATVSEGTIEEATQRPPSVSDTSTPERHTIPQSEVEETLRKLNDFSEIRPLVGNEIVVEALRRGIAHINYDAALREVIFGPASEEIRRAAGGIHGIVAPDSEGSDEEGPPDEGDDEP
jgi:hypothetical protein